MSVDIVVLDSDNESKEKPAICQYTKVGMGFAPTTKTITCLESGVYSFKYQNNTLTIVPEIIHTDKLIRFVDSRSDKLIKEIETFWNVADEFKNGNQYTYGGFVHKRGYLLYGPPGSGKTSLVKFAMSDVISRGGVVFLGNAHPGTISDGLGMFRTIEPDRPCVLIFEDFDEYLDRTEQSEVLSILDGEASIDNVLFIATTNYPSKLDPRIYNRPGRFSDVIKIDMPNVETRRIYLEKCLKDFTDIDYILEHTDGFSLDHLKSLILGVYLEKKPLKEELARLKDLFKPFKDDEGKSEGKFGF